LSFALITAYQSGPDLPPTPRFSPLLIIYNLLRKLPLRIAFFTPFSIASFASPFSRLFLGCGHGFTEFFGVTLSQVKLLANGD
jgi:hypothetical protein